MKAFAETKSEVIPKSIDMSVVRYGFFILRRLKPVQRESAWWGVVELIDAEKEVRFLRENTRCRSRQLHQLDVKGARPPEFEISVTAIALAKGSGFLFFSR